MSYFSKKPKDESVQCTSSEKTVLAEGTTSNANTTANSIAGPPNFDCDREKYLKEKGEYENDALCHRRYATFFWSDSCEYLNNAPVEGRGNDDENGEKKLKALFHRVADCEHERFSVVFKQRTAPLRTHCRYQEDYILASIQQKVDKESKNAYALWKDEKRGRIDDEDSDNMWLYGGIGLLGLASVCLYAYRK